MAKANILIVEDEVVTALEMESTLEEIGYSIISIVDTGEEAVAIAREEKPDLILMDIHLQGEMDGIEAAAQIRSELKIPIIFLTAHAEEDKLERAKLTLPFGYLLKPVQDRDIKATIKMAIYTSEINAERDQAREALKKAHEDLERKVVERTKELQYEIDERIQIEEFLREAKQEAELANKTKSEFLSNISHELRTPMHQILSYSKFGVEKSDSVKREKIVHYFSKIGTIGKNLLALLNDLLDLSKLESGKLDYDMQKKDLKQIIINICEEFSSLLFDKGVNIELSDHIFQKVTCDEYKIGQVIRNILSNAIKFTSSGKKIIISLSNNTLPTGNRRTDKGTISAILITTKDEGMGIPEDELESVFDKFIQSSKTKTGACGTGLGLAICKEIITAHNGKIWAENNSEGGSTFSFLLPYGQEVN
jgi:signal transduction histidine kinase